MLRLAALLLLPLATAAAAQTVTRDGAAQSVTAAMRTLPVRTGGRMVARPLAGDVPRGATGWLHQWPGLYWEAAFRGDRVVLRFDSPTDGYRLLVDALPAIEIAQPGRSDWTVTGLGPGAHRVRLEKLTETEHPQSFDGFYVPRGERALPPPPAPKLQIEFVGPSGMAGYGDRSASPTCTFEQVWRTTDTQAAYPALTAKHFGADYQVNALSGRGLIRNWGGGTDGTLGALYPYTFHDGSVPYADPAWRPKLIDLMLLADFVSPLQPGERWADLDQLTVDWTAALEAFVTDLHKRAPDAAILVEWLDEAGQADPRARAMLARARLAVTGAATAAGVRRIAFVPQPTLPLALTGCNSHGNVADQRAIADWLIGVIEADPTLLGPR